MHLKNVMLNRKKKDRGSQVIWVYLCETLRVSRSIETESGQVGWGALGSCLRFSGHNPDPWSLLEARGGAGNVI